MGIGTAIAWVILFSLLGLAIFVCGTIGYRIYFLDKNQECFDGYAESYCNSIDKEFLKSSIIPLYTYVFFCIDDGRTIDTSSYRFTQEEIATCLEK